MARGEEAARQSRHFSLAFAGRGDERAGGGEGAQSYACCASSIIIADPFSAIIAVGVLVLPEVMVGMIEASITGTVN